MKSILYAGAALMIGASIYGFIDYNKSSQKKQFMGMYDDKKEKPHITIKQQTTITTDIAEEKNATASEPSKILIKTNRDNSESDIKTATDEKKEVVAKKEPTKKFKKVSSKFFSRAPIREEMELDDTAPLTAQPDIKVEIKKQ